MKTISFTEFCTDASALLSEVEAVETFIILRQGKPIAELSSYSPPAQITPVWKEPRLRLQVKGTSLTEAVLAEKADRL